MCAMTVEEFNKTVDLYSDNIFRFVLKSLADEEKAKDIVQDSYEKLWRKIEEVPFEKCKSYLFSTAYHTFIDGIRKEKRQQAYLNEQAVEPAEEQIHPDVNEILHKIILQLPEDQRSVILLRDYEGYSYKEISELTGLSESKVKVYIYRGRLFLKERIGKVEILI